MGNESSQLQRQPGTGDSGGRVIGPAMSPTPSDGEQGRVFGPAMSPLPSEDGIDLREPSPARDRPKSPSKKKKKKQKKGPGSDPVLHEAGPEVAGGDAEEGGEKAAALTTKGKKVPRKKQPAPQLELEDGDEALIQNTQPEIQTDEVEAPHQSPKKKGKKRSKKNATHDRPLENGTDGDGLLDGQALHQTGDNPHQDASRAEDTSPAPDLLQSPFQSMRRTGRKSLADLPSSDAQRLLFSHAQGGLPSSAQQLPLNRIPGYAPGLEENADDESIVPSSQLNWEQGPNTHSQANTAERNQIKPEAPDDDDQLQFHFAGIAVPNFAEATRDPTAELKREDDSPSGLSWLHKDSWRAANPPALDTDADFQGGSDVALPDLQPSQIKMEPVSRTGSDADPDSESDSPSAARLEGLSTRSRSASRASASRAGWLADQDLGLARSARPAPRSVSRGADLRSRESETPGIAPSSTGSNASIPARIEPDERASQSGGSSRPHSRSRSRSRSSSVSSKSGRGVDQVDDEPVEADLSGKKTTETFPSERAETTSQVTQKAAQPTRASDADVDENEMPGIIGQDESTNSPLHRPQIGDEMLSGDGHLVVSSSPRPQGEMQPTEAEAVNNVTPEAEAPPDNPQAVVNDAEIGRSSIRPKSARKRKAKASLVPETEEPVSANAPATDGDVEAEVSVAAASPQHVVRERTIGGNTGSRDDSIEPGESASQPQVQTKGRKKRKLQQNTSLSLTQIEGDDDAMEGPSRLSTFSQAKNPPRGGSNEAEPSEIGASQEPTATQTSRKAKRKRRNANDASDDEMETLLAAGPSKTRKKGGKLGLDDDEDSRAAKRKRLQSSEHRATGPWTSEELGALGRVVEEFGDANGMTQHEVNKMIHEVPNKSDPVNQDFWNKVDLAIPGRTRKQVVERARRLYHNFEGRGTWTDEQKAELHELLEQHGQKASYPWVEIAAAINRDQKDVRDYWRNHYLVYGTQVKSRWNKEEEERLKEVVEEALSKIRIMRENNDQLRPHSRAKAADEEALLDWQQISAAMDLTRSRQQCKWKWTDMREKGLVGDDSIVLPTQPRSSAGAGGSGKRLHVISEELASAREDYHNMSDEDKFRLVDAIHDSGALSDGRIRWATLVDERFRVKWKRPTLKLVWYRLRRTVQDHEYQDVERNARFLVNYYRQNRKFSRIEDNQVDEQVEEKLVRYAPGRRVWSQLSENERAVLERQRRSSKASKHANNRPRLKVSSELLRIEGSDEDEDAEDPSRDESVDLDDEETQQQARRRRGSLEDVPITIPNHLKEDEEVLAVARAKARSKAKGRGKGKEPSKTARSASVALDSDSE